MGVMGFLKFSRICIDFLAWPVIALGYPLFASFRAVETGSVYHMRKLIIYWTLFALISLFEIAFAKITVWIPFWSSIKFVAIFWLVMPQFDGACYAYQILVRPVLSVDLQAVVKRFCKLKEEKLQKRETFLDVAEKYIKENGSEALEKLLANKYESREHDSSWRASQVLEPEGKDGAATTKHLKEPDAATKDNEMLVYIKEIAATEGKQVLEQHAQSTTGAWVPKGMDAAAKVEQTTPPEASAPNTRPQTPPPKTVQQKWICDLCKVSTTSETTLNDHLQGRKHKSNCESLKASKINAKDTGPSTSTGKSNQGNAETGKNKVGQGSQQKSSEKTQERIKLKVPVHPQKQAKPEQDGGANQKSKLYCYVCNVKLLSNVDMASHLKGKQHVSNISKMVTVSGLLS